MRLSRPSHATVIAYAALFMSMTGTAVAATGGTFVLGRANTATSQTVLSNRGAGPVLALSAGAGQAPLAVSSGAGKATNLNADKIDGLEGNQLLTIFDRASDSAKLGGYGPSDFVRTGSSLNAQLLGGLGPSSFQRSLAGSGAIVLVSGYFCPAGSYTPALAGTISTGGSFPQTYHLCQF